MYYCQWCDKEFHKHEVDYRKEDCTFSAPFGELDVVVGGNVYKVPVCPDCVEDLEEVVE